jgi:hypothetical protein
VQQPAVRWRNRSVLFMFQRRHGGHHACHRLRLSHLSAMGIAMIGHHDTASSSPRTRSGLPSTANPVHCMADVLFCLVPPVLHSAPRIQLRPGDLQCRFIGAPHCKTPCHMPHRGAPCRAVATYSPGILHRLCFLLWYVPQPVTVSPPLAGRNTYRSKCLHYFLLFWGFPAALQSSSQLFAGGQRHMYAGRCPVGLQ